MKTEVVRKVRFGNDEFGGRPGEAHLITDGRTYLWTTDPGAQLWREDVTPHHTVNDELADAIDSVAIQYAVDHRDELFALVGWKKR